MQAGGSRIIEYCDMFQTFEFWDIADTHIFNVAMDMKLLDNDIALVNANPFSFWILGGDYCDWISPDDKRFDATILGDMPVSKLSDYGRECINFVDGKFKPIAGKCLAACYGNHDFKYMLKHNQIGLHQVLCDSMNVENLLYSGFFDVYFVHNKRAKKPILHKSGIPAKYERKLRVLVHHGFSSAATPGGKINALARMVASVQADLVMMGHVHEALAKPFVKITTNDECTKLKSRVTMGMITGTYLKCYEQDITSYGEMRGYSPTTLGASRALYVPATGRLSVETVANDVGDKA